MRYGGMGTGGFAGMTIIAQVRPTIPSTWAARTLPAGKPRACRFAGAGTVLIGSSFQCVAPVGHFGQDIVAAAARPIGQAQPKLVLSFYFVARQQILKVP